MRGDYSTFGYATRNHAALIAPQPKLTVRPAHEVLGWSAEQKGAWALAIARRNVTSLEDRYASACRELGKANSQGEMRRYWQGIAFRKINATRKQLRDARKALAAALAPSPAPAPRAGKGAP